MGADARFADDTSLVLHEHPFAAFCQKVLIALYELDLPFRTHLVDGTDARAELADLWPMASIPALRHESANLTVPESTTIIEYLDDLAAGGPRLVPADRAGALQARLWDRFFDQHVAGPMQKIVGDRLRPPGREDPEGVAEARRTLDTAYAALDVQLAPRTWAAGAAGAAFTVADCAARRHCSTRAPSIAGTRTRGPTSRATTVTSWSAGRSRGSSTRLDPGATSSRIRGRRTSTTSARRGRRARRAGRRALLRPRLAVRTSRSRVRTPCCGARPTSSRPERVVAQQVAPPCRSAVADSA
jgi:glutathione S-transferase